MSGTKCFSDEQAVTIIAALINAGCIGLPFSKSFNEEEVKETAKRIYGSNPSVKNFVDICGDAVAADMAKRARLDGIYLISLLEALTTPLTQKEAQRIIDSPVD